MRVVSTFLVIGVLSGCASSVSQTVASPARRSSNDAEVRSAFTAALRNLEQGACAAAVTQFDALVTDHPESRYVSAALYNAGLCLQRLSRWSESTVRYETLLRVRPGSPDTKHTRFQLAFLYLETDRFAEALEVAEMLEAHTGLTPDERSEIMARRAEALLGMGALEDAERASLNAVGFYRRAAGKDRVRDPFFAASAAFTYAETLRLRSEAIAIPEADVTTQRAVLESRAALLLRAQRAYFDAIALGDPYWASAAGYRIGAMYDDLWSAIMTAPVPPPTRALSDAEGSVYRDEYRKRLAELVQPLVRHAIRYWELTLAMIERTGVASEWTERIHADLDRIRARLSPLARGPSRGSSSSEARKQPG